jgi:hypothetical protein
MSLEKMTNVTANSEVLKLALEHLSTKQGKSSGELGELVKSLGAQIHDVSVRLGANPGFVGSTHDSVWNGITVVQSNLETAEKNMERTIKFMIQEGVTSIMSSWLLSATLDI